MDRVLVGTAVAVGLLGLAPVSLLGSLNAVICQSAHGHIAIEAPHASVGHQEAICHEYEHRRDRGHEHAHDHGADLTHAHSDSHSHGGCKDVELNLPELISSEGGLALAPLSPPTFAHPALETVAPSRFGTPAHDVLAPSGTAHLRTVVLLL